MQAYKASSKQLEALRLYLIESEKSPLTIEKYVRDVRYFLAWLGERELQKSEVLAYKAHLMEHYATASVNSMLSSLAGWLRFIGRSDCCVKTLKLHRRPRAYPRRVCPSAASSKK